MTENVEATGPRNTAGNSSAPHPSYEFVVHNVHQSVDPDTPDLVLRRSAIEHLPRNATEDITIIVRSIDSGETEEKALDPHSKATRRGGDRVADYERSPSGDGAYEITRVVDVVIEEEANTETPRVEFSNRYTKKVEYDCS